MKKLPLHWKILIGIGLGAIFGVIAAQLGWKDFVVDWIKPFGTIFINLLKLIAVPLIITSLVKGVSDMKDFSKLSSMGTRTLGIYVLTTIIAISLGVLLANIIQPGALVKEETKEQLLQSYHEDIAQRTETAKELKESSPLQPLVDIVPDNFFKAASENGRMLQVIFFVVLFGIGMMLIPSEKAQPLKDFFDGANEVIMKIIDLIMLSAPYGVFALLAALIVESPSFDLFVALVGYSATVLLGIAILLFAFYPTLIRIFTGRGYKFFQKGIGPAQLVAFSTSSSAATLPVTMERVTEHLGVHEDVSSFVLPVGATVNMDGTALYQAVAALFIAQAMGVDLSFGEQLGIIFTTTLASIGTAAVPGAGVVMLVIILGQAGIPEAGLALILAVDRPLDMCRTMANVTSDATVSMIIAKKYNLLKEPAEKEWDDFYKK